MKSILKFLYQSSASRSSVFSMRCLVGDRRIERQAGETVAGKHPIVGIADVEADVRVFDVLHLHARIHVFLNDLGQLGIVEVQIVGGYGESSNERTCIAALVGGLAEGGRIGEMPVVENVIQIQSLHLYFQSVEVFGIIGGNLVGKAGIPCVSCSRFRCYGRKCPLPVWNCKG